MTCKEVERELVNYYYNEVDATTRSAVSDHISTCPRCQVSWKDLNATLKGVERGVPPIKVIERDYLAGVFKKIKKRQRHKLLVTLVSAITPFVLMVSLGVSAYIIKTKIETSLVAQEYELIEQLDLVQDMEIIQNLEDLEAISTEGA
ncbi:MAG: zf-HC2 domain-containing protein [Candidatus Brocadiaceae bacterium]|nr:zf-HC2 domain-containing protein [Candidatus Brocadiaceae bacterium]